MHACAQINSNQCGKTYKSMADVHFLETVTKEDIHNHIHNNHTSKCGKLWRWAWASEYCVTDDWCQNSNCYCSVQVNTMDPSLSNSTLMDLLNATEDSSPCMCRLSSLACLTYLGLLWSLFSLSPTLQSSSSPFLSLQMQSVSCTQ